MERCRLCSTLMGLLSMIVISFSQYTHGLRISERQRTCLNHDWHYWDQTALQCRACSICFDARDASRYSTDNCAPPANCISHRGPFFECPKLSPNFTCSPIPNQTHLGAVCSGWCGQVLIMNMKCVLYPYENRVVWDEPRVKPCIIAPRAETLKQPATTTRDSITEGESSASQDNRTTHLIVITVATVLIVSLGLTIAVFSTHMLCRKRSGANARLEQEEAPEGFTLLGENQVEQPPSSSLPSNSSRDPVEHEDSGVSTMGHSTINDSVEIDLQDGSVVSEPIEGDGITFYARPPEQGRENSPSAVEHTDPYSTASSMVSPRGVSSDIPHSSHLYSSPSTDITQEHGSSCEELLSIDCTAASREPFLRNSCDDVQTRQSPDAAAEYSEFSDTAAELGDEEDEQTGLKTVIREALGLDQHPQSRLSESFGSECSLPEEARDMEEHNDEHM